MDRINLRPKHYCVRRLSGSSLTRRHREALRLAAHSPVELIVVVMCLPPEVEPDQQQTEGKEQDEGPQQLPLQHTHKHTQINTIHYFCGSTMFN